MRLGEVESDVFDLFANLGATEEQLEFPVMYASAKMGWAVASMDSPRDGMGPLLDKILEHVPPPRGDADALFAFLPCMMSHDNFFGRLLHGRIVAGRARVGMPVHALSSDGAVAEAGRITRLQVSEGLSMREVEEAEAGDIVQVAGLASALVSHTVAAPEVLQPLITVPIDPPTICMIFSVNDSPFAGKVGDRLTSSMIGERLTKEMLNNVSVSVLPAGEAFEVHGRGELQLAVLIENMRREGFELSVSPPRVLYKEAGGQRLEPMEHVRLRTTHRSSSGGGDGCWHWSQQCCPLSPSRRARRSRWR